MVYWTSTGTSGESDLALPLLASDSISTDLPTPRRFLRRQNLASRISHTAVIGALFLSVFVPSYTTPLMRQACD